ncbi:MAG: formyl transferase [Streptosporangiales bacterium]|nr:formyl transferase [Streptosporangiales bacterium]
MTDWQQPSDGRLNVFVHELDKADETPIIKATAEVLDRHGCVVVDDESAADVAVAPLLTRKLPSQRLYAPALGTLIFHPSLLPRHRGPDAIRWAYRLKEPYTGATWFWADEKFDAGDICEMEVLDIRDGERPREFYERAVLPSAIRMLGWILTDLANGVVRRRPQNEEAATYESAIPRST